MATRPASMPVTPPAAVPRASAGKQVAALRECGLRQVLKLDARFASTWTMSPLDALQQQFVDDRLRALHIGRIGKSMRRISGLLSGIPMTLSVAPAMTVPAVPAAQVRQSLIFQYSRNRARTPGTQSSGCHSSPRPDAIHLPLPRRAEGVRCFPECWDARRTIDMSISPSSASALSAAIGS